MSEEDIKVLEKLIKDFDEFEEEYKLTIYMLTKRERKVIEHLIVRYKELEKENEELRQYKHNAELTKVACCVGKNCEALNNCIRTERELQEEKEKNKELYEIKYLASKITNRTIKQFSIGEFRYIADQFDDLYISKDKIKEKIKELRKREREISKLDYTLEPEKAIDCVLLRISDLQELLEE